MTQEDIDLLRRIRARLSNPNEDPNRISISTLEMRYFPKPAEKLRQDADRIEAEERDLMAFDALLGTLLTNANGRA